MTLPPLNGTKTHPLSDHALEELSNLADETIPRQAINPGVANRLLRESLVRVVNLTSPYKTHKGKTIQYLEITKAGRDRLNQP